MTVKAAPMMLSCVATRMLVQTYVPNRGPEDHSLLELLALASSKWIQGPEMID